MLRLPLTLLVKRQLPIYINVARSIHSSCARQGLFEKQPYHLFKPLRQLAPSFPMNGGQIQPLYEPSDFYRELKVRRTDILQ